MKTAYDEVAYEGMPRPYTHPERYFVIGALFGMEPEPVEDCRVLEVGCGDGANLLPMAHSLPQSEFYGIDLSSEHISRGRKIADDLGITNLSLECRDLTQFPPDAGHFHYIIVHGLYTWVPAPVRAAILDLCARHLAPNGIAMVSYNAMPGGHIRRMMRDMMLYHSRGVEAPEAKVEKAKEIVRSLAQINPGLEIYGKGLEPEIKRLVELGSGQLYHDDLAEVYEPVYFHEFAASAATHGLKFLAEADFQEMQAPGQLDAELDRLAADDVLVREQYLDFYLCRKFRASLLCRSAVAIQRHPAPQNVLGLCVGTKLHAVDAGASVMDDSVAVFTDGKGRNIQLGFALGKAALFELESAHPSYILFEDLALYARAHLTGAGLPPEVTRDDLESLAVLMLKLYSVGLIELYPSEPRFITCISECPVAFPLARYQAERGTVVFNLTHRCVKLEDSLTRRMLTLLDGRHTREDIRRDLETFSGQPISVEQVEENLKKVARLTLLVA